MAKDYVLGFFISEDRKNVALIKKTKPDWQAGFLNGIGGKIETIDSSNQEAMIREFFEETGCVHYDWKIFATMKNAQFNVFCFVAYGNPFVLKTTTEEIVFIVPIDKLDINPVLSNIQWLVHMALDCKGFEPVTINYLDADKYIEKQ